jgi:ABC-type branched-subunit amino acid transport system ATPase component
VAESIKMTFGGLVALHQVTLRLAPGEIVGMVGPNGSGKTTLLNVVSGVYRPTEGRVFADGRDVTGWPAYRIARFGVARTFQNTRMFGNFSALENVEVGVAATRGLKLAKLRSTARTIIQQAAVGEYELREASTLPYGIQRRLEIARAVGARPKYLLLDEPAAGMNESESDTHGVGLLVVDHDLRLIMRLCERVLVLNEGRLIAQGSPEEVQASPAVAEAYLGRKGVWIAGGRDRRTGSSAEARERRSR